MWISSLLSIPGALLRWKLGEWFNKGTLFHRRENWRWIPWGTFLANILASIVSIVVTASMTRESIINSQTFDYSSSASLVGASLKIGFAGSLSTVSTFVKEIVEFYDKDPGTARSYVYSLGSLFISCSLCLALYHIIILL